MQVVVNKQVEVDMDEDYILELALGILKKYSAGEFIDERGLFVETILEKDWEHYAKDYIDEEDKEAEALGSAGRLRTLYEDVMLLDFNNSSPNVK